MGSMNLKFLCGVLGVLICLMVFPRIRWTSYQSIQPKPYGEELNIYIAMELSSIADNGTIQDWQIKSAQQGYVMALDYDEQQTAGSRDMQDLQCWAAQYNLSVVEPIVQNSFLVTPLTINITQKTKWFSDIYDIDDWNRLSEQSKHSIVKSWDDFLASAPSQKVILVSVRYIPRNNQEYIRQKELLPPDVSPLFHNCLTDWTAVRNFLRHHQLKVVREVCINFVSGLSLTEEKLKSHLFGPNSPLSSTVIISQWRAIGGNDRFNVPSQSCGLQSSRIFTRALASPRLIPYVKMYKEKYLGGSDYIAIHIRMEKVQLLLKGQGKNVTLDKCVDDLLRVWQETRKQNQIGHTLLAIDMGRFASKTLHTFLTQSMISEIEKKFDEIFRSVYGDRLNVEEWEKSFLDVAGTDDAGYVAALQKILVSQAKCAVLIGGGSFQSHVYNLYRREHSGNHQCIKVIEKCSYKLEL